MNEVSVVLKSNVMSEDDLAQVADEIQYTVITWDIPNLTVAVRREHQIQVVQI